MPGTSARESRQYPGEFALPPPAPTSFRQTLSVLRPGPFRRYMMGEGISMTGTWMQAMAQGWVMTTLTHSAFMLGMVSFAAGVPQLLLTMLGGSFADRYDKRLILLITQVVQILSSLTLGILVLTHRIQLWHVFALAALLGTSNAFEMPAASALVPE
ncbi:MAG: MFS transporter [Candidatus Sericytochromatia bacterium]|nr:MFS transporter [Candidatus Sericytochromatia bacterium]